MLFMLYFFIIFSINYEKFIKNHIKTMGRDAEDFVLNAFSNVFSFEFTILDNSTKSTLTIADLPIKIYK